MVQAASAPADLSAPPAADGPGDARREPRPRTLLSGKVVFGLHDLTGDCTIRNLSSGGAKIQVSLATALPREFWLIVIKQGVVYRASIAWRRGETLGLRFQAAHDLATNHDPELANVRHVWRQLIER